MGLFMLLAEAETDTGILQPLNAFTYLAYCARVLECSSNEPGYFAAKY